MTDDRRKPLRLRNLGGLSLENGGRPIVGAAAQPSRLIMLSVIARSGERGISRDRLLALFWPDSDAERARGALNQALYALRRDVGEQDLLLGTGTLRLNAELASSDAEDFERALGEGSLAAAVSLYRGAYLDGIHVEAGAELEQWMEAERERLARSYSAALLRLAQDADARADTAAALEWWRRLSELDPLSSPAALGRVRALPAAGDRAGAVQHAARHAAVLASELELPPDPAVAALVAQLRAPTPIVAEPARRVAGRVAGIEDPDLPVPAPADVASTAAAPRRALNPVLTAGGAGIVIIGAIVALAARPEPPLTIGPMLRLTFAEELEIDPALSPDGALIAYTAGTLSNMRLYVRQPGRGTHAVAVTSDSGPSQRRPLWSPDGTRLLYLSGRYFPSQLAVVAALGGTPRIVVDSGVRSAAWSPDGLSIAYAQGESLFVRPLAGGSARRVLMRDDMSALAWSPDGRYIALVAGNSNYHASDATNFAGAAPSTIVVADVRSGTATNVTDSASLNGSPVWAPDSRTLLFVSNRDGPRDIYAQQLTPSGQPSGRPQRVSAGLNVHTMSLSADGRRLVAGILTDVARHWSMPVPHGRVADVADLAPVNTGGLPTNYVEPSNDGRRLYFAASSAHGSELYRVAQPGGEAERLTNDTTDDYIPSESPNGQWIAFHSLRFGTRDVMVMPAAGGPAQRVTAEPWGEMIARWSPDSRSLAYIVRDESPSRGVWVVSRDSAGRWGQARQVAPFPNEPAWFPDGRRILIPWDPGNLWVVPADGSAPPVALYTVRPGSDDPGMEVAKFLPDGTIITKSHDAEGRTLFWILPQAGGRPRLVGRFADPHGRQSIGDDLATDGRRIYIAMVEARSDIVTMPLSGLR